MVIVMMICCLMVVPVNARDFQKGIYIHYNIMYFYLYVYLYFLIQAII